MMIVKCLSGGAELAASSVCARYNPTWQTRTLQHSSRKFNRLPIRLATTLLFRHTCLVIVYCAVGVLNHNFGIGNATSRVESMGTVGCADDHGDRGIGRKARCTRYRQ